MRSRRRYITFAARWCPNYSDVYANRTRNLVMESLLDLGEDSPYGPDWMGPANANQILPRVEDAGTQTLDSQGGPCHPISGWRFTLGTGKSPRAVAGLTTLNEGIQAQGAGRVVTSEIFPTPVVTQPSETLYDGAHQAVGTIPGAVTIQLTNAQLAEAKSTDIICGGYGGTAPSGEPLPQDLCVGGLWAQGGTPTEPVNRPDFHNADGTPTFAYAALRCVTDNNYGDNADWIRYAGDDIHAFCYAYYVRPAPPAGTITIRKVVENAPAGTNPQFEFTGSLNFGDTSFVLPVPWTNPPATSVTVDRRAGQTWTVRDEGVAGYHLESLACDAPNTPGHSSASISGSEVAIFLAANEHVTCTFTNRYGAPPSGLRITKQTLGGVGTFDYDVTREGESAHASAQTFLPGAPVDAVPSLTDLAAGTYHITEHRPSSDDGRWRLQSVICDGEHKSTTGPVEVTINESGPGTVCTFTNRFIPRGSISIGKITHGATGTAHFVVSGARPTADSVERPQLDRRLTATTKTPGVEAAATPETPGLDSTNRLRLGQYRIMEQGPMGHGWSLRGVRCNGVEQPFSNGSVVVTLTRDRPHLHCVFTNTFSTHPPPEPAPDQAAPGEDPLAPAQRTANLSVTKRASTPATSRGRIVSFRITVTNHGPDHATGVMLNDQLFGSARLVAVRTDTGRCSRRLPVVCSLGTLNPGANANVTVRMRITGRSSRLRNRAVAGSASADLRTASNVDAATVRVIRPPRPPFTG